jgi:hypothetical protein
MDHGMLEIAASILRNPSPLVPDEHSRSRPPSQFAVATNLQSVLSAWSRLYAIARFALSTLFHFSQLRKGCSVSH